MKKTILFSLILCLNCVFATQSTAFVFSKKGEIAQIAPPQYQVPKMKIWQLKLVERVAKTVKTNPSSVNLTRQAKLSIVYGILGFLIVGFSILSVAILDGLAFLGWLIGFVIALAGIIKGSKVLKNSEATEKEKETAKTGMILSIIASVLIVVLPVLFFIALNKSGG